MHQQDVHKGVTFFKVTPFFIPFQYLILVPQNPL